MQILVVLCKERNQVQKNMILLVLKSQFIGDISLCTNFNFLKVTRERDEKVNDHDRRIVRTHTKIHISEIFQFLAF